MKLLVFICRESLQEHLFSFIKEEGIHAYTVAFSLQVTGETGPAFGDLMTHGANALVLSALPDEQAVRAREGFKVFREQLSQRQQGAAVPMKLMVLPCEEMI